MPLSPPHNAELLSEKEDKRRWFALVFGGWRSCQPNPPPPSSCYLCLHCVLLLPCMLTPTTRLRLLPETHARTNDVCLPQSIERCKSTGQKLMPRVNVHCMLIRDGMENFRAQGRYIVVEHIFFNSERHRERFPFLRTAITGAESRRRSRVWEKSTSRSQRLAWGDEQPAKR